MADIDKAPAEEPAGYRSAAGFVKSQPSNNAHYVEQFVGDDWYEIIKWTDEQLEKLIPGYNISQIKEKFGELRYYFDYPEVIPINAEWPAFDSVEKIRAMVDSKITYAEGWVAGFENAKRKFTNAR